MLEAAINSWESLKLNPSLHKALAEAGFQHPTEIQRKVIPLVLGGQAVIGVAQTGTGKTAAYILPLLKKLSHAQGNDPRALVLVPTKELVVQIAAHAVMLASRTDLRMVGLYGGVGPKTQIEQLQAGVDLIISTPGRFMELYHKEEIVVKQIKTLVLDEADRMLDMGFFDDIASVVRQCPKERQTLLFSATYPEGIARLASQFMREPLTVKVEAQHAGGQIEQRWYEVTDGERLHVVSRLLNHFRPDSTLAFCNTKAQCRDLAAVLKAQGFSALALFGELEQRERDQVLVQFANRSCSVLVATDRKSVV